MNERTHAGYSQVSAAAERIVRTEPQVRGRIAGLAVNTFRLRGSRVEELAPLVEEILLGVVAGLAGAGRAQRDQLLRQVFEGLADAYAQIGRQNQRADQWEQFEARITEAVTTIASRAGEDIMSEFRNVAEQVREAGEKFKPRAKAAIHAIEEKVIEPASEAAAQGAKSARRTLGVLLAAAGEMLRDFGDSIKQEAGTPSRGPSRARSASAKNGRSSDPSKPNARAASSKKHSSAKAASAPGPSAPRPSAPKPSSPKQRSAASKPGASAVSSAKASAPPASAKPAARRAPAKTSAKPAASKSGKSKR